MRADQIEAEFAALRVAYAGGLLLLEAPNAVALIRRAAEERVAVLGVNCLLLTEHETREPIDQIADYSSAVRNGHGCWEDAVRHVANRVAGGYVFEVVLDDAPERAP
ncbi:MAG: hypothetical protein ACREND_16405 [Gemmatimonadaceae bacterium]